VPNVLCVGLLLSQFSLTEFHHVSICVSHCDLMQHWQRKPGGLGGKTYPSAILSTVVGLNQVLHDEKLARLDPA